MEISPLTTRPQAPILAQIPVVSQQTEQVSTDLPPSRTVTAVSLLSQTRPRAENNRIADAASIASAPSASDENNVQNRTRRQTVMDWSTNQPVFRVIDERSGQTISQMPDQALLRLRAYVRQQNLAVLDKSRNPAA